ncbi:MAG: hypothetical protein JWM80_203 [Cyanobacteria bacterium RYN_339]|nr:hypothetical protein [Cyanobacteria bacterium RYN_339]
MRTLHVLSLALSAALLSACGAHPTAAVAKFDQAAAVRAAGDAKLEKPVVASTVLAYGHAVARTLDPKASFMSLTGTQIAADGTPTTGGHWEIQYVGSTVAAPAGAKPNPYSPWIRRITVTVSPEGKTKLKETAQSGLPLGVSYMDAPMPGLDSDRALDLFFKLRGDEAKRQPLHQVALAGMAGPHHFDRLVWRLTPIANSTDGATVLDATSGEVIQQVGASVAKP